MVEIKPNSSELIVAGLFRYNNLANVKSGNMGRIETNELLAIWSEGIPGVTAIKMLDIDGDFLLSGNESNVTILIWHPYPIRYELVNSMPLCIGFSRPKNFGIFVSTNIVGFFNLTKK